MTADGSVSAQLYRRVPCQECESTGGVRFIVHSPEGRSGRTMPCRECRGLGYVYQPVEVTVTVAGGQDYAAASPPLIHVAIRPLILAPFIAPEGPEEE